MGYAALSVRERGQPGQCPLLMALLSSIALIVEQHGNEPWYTASCGKVQRYGGPSHDVTD